MQSTENQELNPIFIRQMQDKLGSEANAFFASLESPPPVSVLLNPGCMHISLFHDAARVPWNEDGRYLASRPEFIFDPLFHAGCYYVMEPSSMCIGWVLRQIIAPQQPVRVLDMCAAPGGKSSVLVGRLPSGSLLISNEVHRQRFQVLQQNMDKWGMANVVRCNLDPEQIPLVPAFDIILVDAPCSGEGLFRKDKDAREEWSPSNVALCSARQRRILDRAVQLLKPGGCLIYSTCTYNDSENMEQVSWMQQQHSMRTQQLPFDPAWGVEEIVQEGCHGYQFYPHKVKGEGLFVSLLRKEEGEFTEERKLKGKASFNEIRLPAVCRKWVKDSEDLRCFQFGDGRLFVLQTEIPFETITSWHATFPGTEIGEFKGDDFIPAHALALSSLLHPDVPVIGLDAETAITYLRKDPVPPVAVANGWYVVTYSGKPLGWVKQTQAGLKNYFPVKYRILKSR